MKFKFLGTAASEGFPGVFCRCALCKEALRLGGRNVRTRSQAIVNEDLLIDLPPDTYMHKLQQGLDLSAVKYLLVTHKHMDHFYPQELTVRGAMYSHEMLSEDLEIYCAQEVKDFFYMVSGWELEDESDRHMRWHILKPYETVSAGPYRITPLPASHMHAPGSQPFIYHFEDEEGRSVLYLHDSGYYKQEVWDYFEKAAKEKGPVSLISFDATIGSHDTDRGGHMGFPEVYRAKWRMEEIGIAGPETVCVLSHFSHNGGWLHEDMVRSAEKEGCLVAFDGMEVLL